MNPANEGEQWILGYDLDGNPQSFCWSVFWQVLICASGEHKRNKILQKLLKYDVYAGFEIITLKQKSREIDTVLTDLVGDIRERYTIVSKALETRAINGYPSFYEPYLAHNGKSNVLLIIKEPTKWQPNFYRDNEEALQEILRPCGRVGIRVIITDKYENVPPNIRIFMSTIIAKLGFEE